MDNKFSSSKIWFLAIVASLGGFLFGFDTIVINGAEQDIQKLWSLSGQMHGWVVSSALWGTVLGALLGGFLTDRFGRKKTLLGIGALFFASAVWSALASGPWELIAARAMGGLGIGVSTNAAPVYIAEISPDDKRGRLTALFQFNIVFGVLVALTSNLLLKDVGPNAWRWMLGAAAVPSFAFLVLAPFLVESPRWLARKTAAPTASDAARCCWLAASATSSRSSRRPRPSPPATAESPPRASSSSSRRTRSGRARSSGCSSRRSSRRSSAHRDSPSARSPTGSSPRSSRSSSRWPPSRFRRGRSSRSSA